MSNIFSLDKLVSIFERHGHLLWEGLYFTVLIYGLSLVVGAVLAVFVAYSKLSRSATIRFLGSAYVAFFRGSPLLVQLFLIYFGLAQFSFIRDSVLWVAFSSPVFCAVLALALNEAAYLGEVLRGGLKAIPTGEIEAADVYGFSRVKKAIYFELPQALRLAWGPIGNEAIYLLKSTALVSTITVLDMTGQARIIVSKTFAPLETYVLVGVAYYLFSKLISYTFKAGERRLQY